MRVLDLACGKGGDIGKWLLHTRGIRNYVGIDVARGSLVDAAIRVRKIQSKFASTNCNCVFTCADLGSDVPGRYKSTGSATGSATGAKKQPKMQKLLSWSLLDDKNKDAKIDPIFANTRGGGIALDDKFDVVSIQFAIHYMMQTRQRARRFFRASH